MSSQRATGPSPYHRLDLTGVTLPPAVLVGTHGRAAMLDAARAAGYPPRTVTPALTRFSRVYVIALGGDPDTGAVILGTADRREVTVKLPVDARYRILPQTRVERMLAAVGDDYPPGSVTAALAQGVVGGAARVRPATRHRPIRDLRPNGDRGPGNSAERLPQAVDRRQTRRHVR